MILKKAVGWITLIAAWVVLGTVFWPPLISKEWFFLVAAATMFTISGSVFTAAKINEWPWDIEDIYE